MKLELPAQVRTALRLLSEQGFEGFAVGGCVRDSLLGRSPGDWDITTDARPDETKSVFAGYKVLETGLKHGTLTVLLGGLPLEITTYRIDGPYRDARHPLSVTFSKSLRDDLARRDFTVNTLCCGEDGRPIDLFGGGEDLKNGLLRCVGEPEKRFQEDALRILRALRFASAPGFEIEKKTAEALLKNRRLLSKVSAERIQKEFVKLLCGQNAPAVIERYHAVIEVFIPELTALIGCEQRTPYHNSDVFLHSLHALGNIEADKNLRLAMFFHDFGKPAAKTTDEDGVSHFKGHARLGATMTEDILKRLRFDGKTAAEVTRLVLLHDTGIPKTKAEAKKLLRRVGEQCYLDLIAVKRADTLAKARPHARDRELDEMRRLYDEILQNGECCSLAGLAVDGDVLKAAGIPEGAGLRRALEFLLGEVIEGRCDNEKEALLRRLNEHRAAQ